MVTAMKAHLEDLKFPAARTVSKAEDPVSFCSLSMVSSAGPYEFFPCRSSSSKNVRAFRRSVVVLPLLSRMCWL